MNRFTIFNLPVAFALDTTALSSRYRDLQATVHPDRFINATDAEKRVAMTRTVAVNDAYTTLKDPVRRAMHMLTLAGFDGMDARDTSMPHDFLVEQIDWREALADARLKEDDHRLDEMSAELAGILRSLGDTFDAAYRGQHFTIATTLARKMRFMQKLAEEVDASLAALDA